MSKAGDTRVGFVGFPSVGKSTLLTRLTGTHSEAAAYEASARDFLGFGVKLVFPCFACLSYARLFSCLDKRETGLLAG